MFMSCGLARRNDADDMLVMAVADQEQPILQPAQKRPQGLAGHPRR
jgi:hypothetical protein